VTTLPTGAAERKNIPIVRGLLDYFPAALAAVAELSRIGNEQHNPGEEMHWARGKSSDHADCAVRHLMDRGTLDTDKVRHSTKAAWRALANLQIELEEAGAPMARGARLAVETPKPKFFVGQRVKFHITGSNKRGEGEITREAPFGYDWVVNGFALYEREMEPV